MLPTINLGRIVLPSAGIVYLFGAWLSLSMVERAAKRMRLPVATIYSLAATILAAGFVGARLVFVALHWQAYQRNLLGIVWPLTSGFHVGGGLIIGVVAGVYYGRAKRLTWADSLDALAPGVVTILMTVSLADFLAGPGFGKEALLPWSVSLFDVRRHPVQLYELIVGLLSLVTWWFIVQRRCFSGQLCLVTSAVYSAGRLVVDAFRSNASLIGDGYHFVQILSLSILLVSLLVLARKHTNKEEAVH